MIVAYLLAAGLFVIVAIIALIFNRPLVLIVIASCMLISLSIVRFVKGHPWASVSLTVGLIILGLFVWFASLSFRTGATHEVGVPYTANMSINGGRAVIDERITIDKSSLEAFYECTSKRSCELADAAQVLSADQARLRPRQSLALIVPSAWSLGPVIDGNPTFDRQTTLQIRTPIFGAATVEVPIDLGEVDLYSYSHRGTPILFPRSGSTFAVIARKGAIAATYPASASRSDLLRDHLEQTVINVSFDNSSVRLAILSPILQNQAGIIAYQIIAWGPLPWVTGSVTLVIIGAFGRRLTDWLDQILKQAVPWRRKKKTQPRHRKDPTRQGKELTKQGKDEEPI
jgi:hypothetical protein